jgi:hypothetical protein
MIVLQTGLLNCYICNRTVPDHLALNIERLTAISNKEQDYIGQVFT